MPRGDEDNDPGEVDQREGCVLQDWKGQLTPAIACRDAESAHSDSLALQRGFKKNGLRSLSAGASSPYVCVEVPSQRPFTAKLSQRSS